MIKRGYVDSENVDKGSPILDSINNLKEVINWSFIRQFIWLLIGVFALYSIDNAIREQTKLLKQLVPKVIIVEDKK